MIVGSMANTMGAAGGFCAGSTEVIFHQRINGPSYVYSAALPAMLAVASSLAINKVLTNEDDVLGRLRENIRALRGVVDHIESLYIPSADDSPVIHLQIRPKSLRHPDTSEEKFERERSRATITPASSAEEVRARANDPEHDLLPSQQVALLKAILDDAFEHGVFAVLHKRLPSIKPEVLERGVVSRPSIRLGVTAGLSRKDTEKAANVLKASVVKLVGKRRV